MDDHQPPAEAAYLPFQIPDAPPEGAAAPLRLLLQPNGLIVELTRVETVVGRHADVNLRLPLPDVSRRHCRILYTGTAWKVEDLNSLNGVFINDQRVREAELHDHDRIRIGGFTFEVDMHAAGNRLPADPPGQVIRSIADALSDSRKAS